jgi:hypothetical protein
MAKHSLPLLFLVGIAAYASFFSGCCSTKNVADPKDITLSNALVSVAVGLNAMREAGADKQPFGLYPSDVEVTFNVSAAQDDTGELKLDLSAPVASPVTASAGGSVGYHSTATRGNQITVKFSNLMLADPNTLVAHQGSNIVDLIKYLRQEGLIELMKKEQK